MEPLVITDHVKNCAYAIYAVMLAVSLIVYGAGWILKKDLTNFKLRLKSFWLIIILFTVAFSFNKVFAFFFLALINYLALKEFFSLVPTRRADRRVLLWAYLAIETDAF